MKEGEKAINRASRVIKGFEEAGAHSFLECQSIACQSGRNSSFEPFNKLNPLLKTFCITLRTLAPVRAQPTKRQTGVIMISIFARGTNTGYNGSRRCGKQLADGGNDGSGRRLHAAINTNQAASVCPPFRKRFPFCVSVNRMAATDT